MARYSGTFHTSRFLAGTVALEVIAGPIKGFRLYEIGFTLFAATASMYSLGRPAAKGIGPTALIPFLRDDFIGDPNSGSARVELASWSTAPTTPSSFIRKSSLPATVGAERIWTFPKGIWVPPNGSIVLHNDDANSLVDAFIVIEE
jgi:hypothetical protein